MPKQPYGKAKAPFKMKGWSGYQNSPLKDDNLKGVDISSASIESLRRMEKETDRSTSPNDWAKINDAISFNIISKKYKKGELTPKSKGSGGTLI